MVNRVPPFTDQISVYLCTVTELLNNLQNFRIFKDKLTNDREKRQYGSATKKYIVDSIKKCVTFCKEKGKIFKEWHEFCLNKKGTVYTMPFVCSIYLLRFLLRRNVGISNVSS
jgi:hypothetical protein